MKINFSFDITADDIREAVSTWRENYELSEISDFHPDIAVCYIVLKGLGLYNYETAEAITELLDTDKKAELATYFVDVLSNEIHTELLQAIGE
jgi:hypothetical protein